MRFDASNQEESESESGLPPSESESQSGLPPSALALVLGIKPQFDQTRIDQISNRGKVYNKIPAFTSA